ncbi:MAG TPA: hypothetical protein VFV99_24410 [Kofleriaceae bacterium]|nr:hypothetical protein [Kofleriaceae bacterium]
MRFVVVLFVACSGAKPTAKAAQPATTEQPVANGTHSCADAALGLENATRGVRAPEQAVFDTLRARCLEDVWTARAVDCFATMAEGELGKCSRIMTDAQRETVFAALAGNEGGNIYVTRARLEQLQVGVPECDRFVTAVTTVLSCEKLSLEDRLQLGNETAEFWSLPTNRLSREDKLRISEVCGQSLQSLEQHALDVGCML